MQNSDTFPLFLDGRIRRGTQEFFSIFETEPGIYDVLRVLEGVPIFLEDHIARIRRSAAPADFPFPLPANRDIEAAVGALLREHGPGPYSIKLIFSRSRKGSFCIAPVPRRIPGPDNYRQGVRIKTFHFARPHPQIKEIDSGYTTRIQQEIIDDQVFEILLVDEQDRITEGGKSNIFFVAGSTLITPPSNEVLPGITRGKILSLAREEGIPAVEKDVFTRDLKEYDAAFLTGTSIFVLPAARIDGLTYPSAENPLVNTLTRAYGGLVSTYIQKKHNKSTG